jgi:predicted ATP-binding protein involved in virulence
MKINKIHFKNHPFFGTKDIDFSGPDGNRTLNTVVIGGINGSGKTTLLNAVVDMMTNAKNRLNESYIDIELTELFEKKLLKEGTVYLRKFNAAFIGRKESLLNKFEAIDEKERPKIVYMPTEINFSRIMIEATPYTYTYEFLNIVDENVTKDVPNFFATFIDRYVYSKNLLPDQSIKLACEEINALFKELEIESWIVGIKKDGSRMPIFRNKAGKEFDITGLSSGEKQLFFRIIGLKMMDINNSIILNDEPEISLHPSWQQKIIKVYENIGENNQVIAVTHSPHVLSSVPNESIRLLVNPADIQVLDHKDLKNAYGAPIKRVLKDLMGLKSDRDPEIQQKIDGLKRYLKHDDYDPAEFELRFNELEEVLGTTDEDLVRIRVGRLRTEKRNAK